MADFCLQCCNKLGFELNDLDGITSQEDWARGKAALVLCEGCGPIQVSPSGRCLSPDCLEKHGDPKEVWGEKKEPSSGTPT